MQVKRSLRVAGLLKREISYILIREAKDPALRSVTVTNVKLTDDLKQAKVYINSFDTASIRDELMQGLERAKKFIRAEIAHRTDLRYVPELFFFYDETADYVASIEGLIKKIHSEEE